MVSGAPAAAGAEAFEVGGLRVVETGREHGCPGCPGPRWRVWATREQAGHAELGFLSRESCGKGRCHEAEATYTVADGPC